MWHASVSFREPRSRLQYRAALLAALKGVGDSSKGEWSDRSPDGAVFHLRRRLTALEEKRSGPPADIRGTPEALQRQERMAEVLGLPLKQIQGFDKPPRRKRRRVSA